MNARNSNYILGFYAIEWYMCKNIIDGEVYIFKKIYLKIKEDSI